MPYSKYPNGFNEGVLLREVLNLDVLPRRVLYVGNNANRLPDEFPASDLNPGTWNRPFSTIDAAYNATGQVNGGTTTTGSHDVIFVRPGHALSIANATTLVMDKDNVVIVGMGHGEERPTITFATATSAAIPITGTENVLANMIFVCNIASQNHMLDVKGDALQVVNCDFREGSATGLSFITADTADNDSDYVQIRGCRFYAPTAGNYDNAISLAKDFLGVRIKDCEILGDFDDAGIDVPTGGNAQRDLLIENCKVENLQTGRPAIQLNGTGNTGRMVDCFCTGDTLGSIVDSGGLEMFRVYEHSGADQVNAQLVGGVVASVALVDDTNNPIGVNDSDNAFVSSNVVANVDGSVLERLEAIMDPLGGFNPALGFRVTKTSNLADGAGTDNLFTVAGRCLITHLSGEVTTVIGGAATMKLRDITNSIDLCAATTIDTDAVGTMYALPGLSAQILNGTGGTPVVGSVPNVATPSNNAGQIIGDAQAPLTIAHVLDAADTGNVAWVLYYWPLVSGATIVAAA